MAFQGSTQFMELLITGESVYHDDTLRVPDVQNRDAQVTIEDLQFTIQGILNLLRRLKGNL